LPMKMEQSVPKRPAYKIQKPGNYPEGNIKHTEHGEILKSRIDTQFFEFIEYHSTCFGLSVHRHESKTVHTASGICHTGSLTAC
jgi:hypothetical protein